MQGRARVRLLLNETPAVLTVPHGPRPPDEPSAEFANGITVEVLGLHPYPGDSSRSGAAPEVEITALRHDA